ncbi:tetratricopeptide repeat protein [Stutzerimonas chloritidismutans]|uniref:tetratricopeptide repeat protein n=1 Tax=Stutzerimonas chloritidismutans TaxID=203192 RepID=UPI003F5CC933
MPNLDTARPLLLALLLSACASQPTNDSHARLMKLAQDVERRGDPASASSLYQQATQQPGATAATWQHLAKARLDSGDARGAERAYRQALELTPDDAELQLGLGTALLHLGELERAATTLASAAARLESPVAYSRLGVAEVLRGQPGAAQVAFTRAVALEPEDLDARYNLALAQALDAQPQQALATIDGLDRSPRIQPRHQRNTLLILVLSGQAERAARLPLDNATVAERDALIAEAQRIAAISDPAAKARALGLIQAD